MCLENTPEGDNLGLQKSPSCTQKKYNIKCIRSLENKSQLLCFQVEGHERASKGIILSKHGHDSTNSLSIVHRPKR
jgi:hypothetical protein